MAPPPLKPRHYENPAGLVIRTQGDLSPDELRGRARRNLFTAALLDVRPSRPHLVGTAEGAFRRLLLTIPAYAAESEPLAAAYRDLLGALPSSAALVILTHESAASTVNRWLASAGRTTSGDGADTVVEAPDHLNFSVWAEDGYVVVTDAGGDGGGGGEGGGEATYFVEPYAFPRYGDGLIAEFVSNVTDLRKAQAPLYFQGGNVLIGDDFFLIGADYPAESLDYVGDVLMPSPGESPADLVRRLYGEYLDTGRRLHYVGSTIPVPAQAQRTVRIDGEQWTEIVYTGNAPGTAQPIFHIDMFISLAGRGSNGKYRVLVGDPAEAAALVGEPVRPEAMKEVFDSVAAGLRRLGFEVIRNPLPLAYVDDPDAKLRQWYFATANNALVEITGEGQHVYLPTYAHGPWTSLAPVDQRNEEVWRELGFTTHPLGDFHPFASALGAVHCIKKYLARG